MSSRRRDKLVAGGWLGSRWTPAKPLSGNLPALRMLADDIAGSDGDAIASWVSKEGNSYDFAQATAAKKPLLKKGANGINGHNVARFDGVDDLLVYAGANISNASQGTLIAVVRLTSIQNNEVVFSSLDEATAALYGVVFRDYYDATHPAMEVGQVNNDTNDSIRGSTTPVIDTTYIVVWKSSGTAYALRLNGASESLTIISGANNGDWFGDTANRDNFVIGGLKYTAESQFLKGDLPELLLYDVDLSSADLSIVERYYASRYGVTLP